MIIFTEVDPVINTTDYTVIQNALGNITLGGFRNKPFKLHDCPEHSLHGINESLIYAEPKSIMFVVTDDDANDIEIEDKVLEILLEKQINVYFLLTYSEINDPTVNSKCKKSRDSERPGYAVYERIAQNTNGLIYDMKKKSVEDVLIAISPKIKANYADLFSKDYKKGSKNVDKIEIQNGVTQLIFTVVGKNPSLTIYDSAEKKYEGIKLGDNAQSLIIDNPQNGTWTVHSEDKLAYSIKVGGLVEDTFDYGFSLGVPNSKNETLYRPIIGEFHYPSTNPN
jgi:hypothetical protein